MILPHALRSVVGCCLSLALVLLAGSVWAALPSMSMTISGGWQYKQVGRSDQWRAAVVPGCVHTDLQRDGVIKDPLLDQNEKELGWIDYADWEYKTSFNVGSSLASRQKQELVFEGLDTYATVYLNGKEILKADNMFRTWRVNVTKTLVEGENNLLIVFRSAMVAGMERRSKYPKYWPNINEQINKAAHTSTYVRKAPYHYGWDWGLRMVTAGIYRPIKLVATNEVQIEDLYWQQTSFSPKLVQGKVQVSLTMMAKTKVNVVLKANGTKLASQTLSVDTGLHTVTLPVQFQNPKIWWPNGLGAHPLYDLVAEVETEDENTDTRQTTIGLCDIKLVQKPDAKGKSFYFEVNGKPTFIKGANYLPPSHFVANVDSAKYAETVRWAVDANMNMLRVWGGAVYADDRFYRQCAEQGIMCWNEFMFACSAYPGDDEFINSIRAEATDNIKRVRNWPNIPIWSGNNENINGVRGWFKSKYKSGETDSLEVEKAFQRIFYKELRERMTTLAPHIAYWPTSPQSKELELENLKEGDNHDWSVYFGKKLFSNFADHTGRFVSEYGMQSFPALSTFRRVDQADQLYLGSVAVKHRQRSPVWLEGRQQSGTEAIIWYSSQYYKPVKAFEHVIYQGQLMQALCLREAIEAHRSQMATCGGSMYWQINDTWPGITWSTVDYFGNWKAGHYQVRNHYKPILPMVRATAKNYDVIVASDLRLPQKATIIYRLLDFSGNVLMTSTKPVVLSPLTSKTYCTLLRKELPAKIQLEQTCLQVVVLDGKKELASTIYYFVKPAELVLAKPSIERIINPIEDGYRITLSSSTLVKDLYLNTKNGNGHFSNNYFDLLPGQKVVVDLKVGKLENYQDEINLLSLFDTLEPTTTETK